MLAAMTVTPFIFSSLAARLFNKLTRYLLVPGLSGLNNATNLHHLTPHSWMPLLLILYTSTCRFAARHRDRSVTTDYYDITSPYVLRRSANI